jgi:hypothetical protein
VISTVHASIFANILATALTLPLPAGVTIAVAVGWIPLPVFGPVVTVARRSRPLHAGLVVAIVRIAGALGLLPAPSAFPLAGRRAAKALLGTLCPRPLPGEPARLLQSQRQHTDNPPQWSLRAPLSWPEPPHCAAPTPTTSRQVVYSHERGRVNSDGRQGASRRS